MWIADYDQQTKRMMVTRIKQDLYYALGYDTLPEIEFNRKFKNLYTKCHVSFYQKNDVIIANYADTYWKITIYHDKIEFTHIFINVILLKIILIINYKYFWSCSNLR